MFNIFTKLKKEKWYKIEDGFEVFFKEKGVIDIKFGSSKCSLNIPSLIAFEYYKAALLPMIEKLNGNYEFLTEDEAKLLKIEDLNFILSEMENAENYEVCEMIKRVINEKRKNNKKS